MGRVELAERYVAWLADAGTERGLIGPREVERLWERHVLNSAVVGEWIEDGRTVADVGSGAGLPGIPLALARPDLKVTLVEPLLRRATFLQEVVDDLRLDVEVVRARAEELHGERSFDVVTSRAVAPLDRLASWCMPLVARAGAMVALKGSSVEEEIAEHQSTLSRHGAGAAEARRLGSGASRRYLGGLPEARRSEEGHDLSGDARGRSVRGVGRAHDEHGLNGSGYRGHVGRPGVFHRRFHAQ